MVPSKLADRMKTDEHVVAMVIPWLSHGYLASNFGSSLSLVDTIWITKCLDLGGIWGEGEGGGGRGRGRGREGGGENNFASNVSYCAGASQ